MRPLTKDELQLISRAHKVLGTPIKPNTNITALSLILAGKSQELEKLICEVNTNDN